MHGPVDQVARARTLGLGNRRQRLRLRGRHHALADRCAAGRRHRRRRTHHRSGRHRLARAGAARHVAPQGVDGAHVVDFGVQLDDYRTADAGVGYAPTGSGGAGRRVASRLFAARRELQSVYAQDSWRFAERLARDARRARGALAGLRWRDLQRDEHPDLRRAQRDLCLAKSGARLASDPRLGAEGVGRPRGAHADGVRAVPGLDRRRRDREQRSRSRSRRNPGPASSPRNASSATDCCVRPTSTKTRATRCIRRPTSPSFPT